MLLTRMLTLAFLLLELSPFLHLNLISCPLCNLNTLHNILMILSRNVEQDETACPKYKNDNSGRVGGGHLFVFFSLKTFSSCRFFPDFLYKSICCGNSFELHRQFNAIQMGTHNILYTGCNLKITKLLDCVLIRVCAVIKWNMVRKYFKHLFEARITDSKELDYKINLLSAV